MACNKYQRFKDKILLYLIGFFYFSSLLSGKKVSSGLKPHSILVLINPGLKVGVTNRNILMDFSAAFFVGQ